MKKTILVMIVSLLFTTQVLAKHNNDHSKRSMMKVFAQLDLNEQQKQDIRAQLRDSRADRDIYREDNKQLRGALRDIINADDWDEAAVTETLLANADLKQQQLNSRALAHHNIWLLLTAEQQQKLDSITTEREENAGDTQRKLKRQNRWDKIANRLDLSAQQASEIEQIREQFNQQQRAFDEVRKAHKSSETTIIRSANFDQTAWDSLYAEHEQAALDHAVARAYMQHQIMNVLTDEQAEKLEKFGRKMKKKLKRPHNS